MNKKVSNNHIFFVMKALEKLKIASGFQIAEWLVKNFAQVYI